MLLPPRPTRHARATKIFHRFVFFALIAGPQVFGSPQTETSTLLVHIGSRWWGSRGRQRRGFRARGSLDCPAAVSPRASGSADDDIASTSSGTQTSCPRSILADGRGAMMSGRRPGVGKGGGVGGLELVGRKTSSWECGRKVRPEIEGIASRVRGLHNLLPQDSQSCSWKTCGSRPTEGPTAAIALGLRDPADDDAPMISIDGPCARSRSNLGSGKSGNPGSLILDHRARPPSRPPGE